MQRYSDAGKFLKYMKMFVQTGTCHHMPWVDERKGGGQGTHMAEDVFCGFCHEKMHILRVGLNRDSYSIAPARPSLGRQYPSNNS